MNAKDIIDRVHIIVGPNGECMCGSQKDGQIMSCKGILKETLTSLILQEPEVNPKNSHPMNNFEGVGTSNSVEAKYYKDKLLEIAQLKDKPVAVSCAVKIARNALGLKTESEKRCEWVQTVVNGSVRFIPSCDKETTVSSITSSFISICPFCKRKTSWTANETNGNQSKSPEFTCKICGKEQKYDPEYDCLEFCKHYEKCVNCGKKVLIGVENLSDPLLCDECIANGVDIGVVVELDESKKVK
jgi:hypothetical protein